MKKKILASSLVLLSASLQAESTPTLEQRIEQLETASYLQSIQWNGIFEYRYDSIQSEEGTTKNSFNPMRLKALLDASTHIDPQIQFYMRFGLEKYTNDFVNQGTEGATLDGPRQEKGVNLKLERAFVNYSITKDIVASLGRLPTVDGPPTEMYDNSPRLGTYPLLAYGAILDGLALTYNWGFLPERHKFATRFIYTPLYNTSSDSSLLGNISAPTYNGLGTGPILQEKSSLYAVMADYETKSIPIMSKFNFIAQAVIANDFNVSDQISRGTNIGAVLASPAFGGDGVGTEISHTAGGTGAGDLKGSTEKFGFTFLTANTTLTNIADTNINFGMTYLHTKIESKGSLESSTTLRSVLNAAVTGAGGTAAQATAIADKLGVGKGIMTDSSDDVVQGGTLLATFTYATPFSFIKNPIVGGEYLHGSRGVQYFGFAQDNLTSFYSTRGNGYHAFWSQPLAAGLNLRLGYMYQDHHYSKGYIGAPTVSSLNEKTLYGNFRYTF